MLCQSLIDKLAKLPAGFTGREWITLHTSLTRFRLVKDGFEAKIRQREE
jgi:hypothetical protein